MTPKALESQQGGIGSPCQKRGFWVGCIPLPSSNRWRRLILWRFSSWRIWMCSSIFTPEGGGTGTAENTKKAPCTGSQDRWQEGKEGGGGREGEDGAGQNKTKVNEWWGDTVTKQWLSNNTVIKDEQHQSKVPARDTLVCNTQNSILTGQCDTSHVRLDDIQK